MLRLACKANDVISFDEDVMIKIVSAKGGVVKLEILTRRYPLVGVSQNSRSWDEMMNASREKRKT